jgi:hypothetical protein
MFKGFPKKAICFAAALRYRFRASSLKIALQAFAGGIYWLILSRALWLILTGVGESLLTTGYRPGRAIASAPTPSRIASTNFQDDSPRPHSPARFYGLPRGSRRLITDDRSQLQTCRRATPSPKIPCHPPGFALTLVTVARCHTSAVSITE